MKETTQKGVLEYVSEEYGILPDYPWEDDDSAVLRHPENRKWFGLIMHIPVRRLGLDEDREADVLNVKCDPVMLGSMLMEKGFFPAYHMNKSCWLSVLLDGSVPGDKVFMVLDLSYELTAPKAKAKKVNKT